jgi:SAM-dependent methyltransferase
MNAVIELGALPFNIGARPAPTNSPFPDELPFAVRFDERLGVIAQAPNPKVAAVLGQVYTQGSQLGTPMNDYGLGKATCDDFIGFLLATLGQVYLTGAKILEIGCGTGFLLAQLKALGGEAVGIEPGATSSVHAERAGIPVIHEPFETAQLSGNFDLIVHAGVLEHVSAPLDFLVRQMAILSRRGRIALVVPDCGPPIAHGDISMFVHEHWSYFTQASLTSLITSAGGQVISMAKAGVGGALYAMLQAGQAVDSLAAASDYTRHEFGSFNERASRGQDAIRAFFAVRRQSKVGIYCPGRFLNYWGLAGRPVVRLFDDDNALYGRYFPPIPFPVETRAQLLREPVDSLLIMSRTFGVALAADLRDEAALRDCEIVTVAELF